MTKHCPDWEDRLLDWAEAELPAAQLPELREHLQRCAACRGLASRLQVSLEVVSQGWEEAATPAEEAVAVTTIAHGLATRTAARSTTRAWSAWVAAAAAVLVIVGWGGWQLGSSRWASTPRPEISADGSGVEQQTPPVGSVVEAEVEAVVEADPEARWDEIEAEIRRREQLAILRALNQLLADTPGTEAIQASNRAQIEQWSRN
jgi:hypothetical protein